MRRIVRLARCTHGTSLLEMALLLPLLLLLLGGMLELGRALHHHHVVENAVRNATRYLSRVDTIGQTAGAPCTDTAGTEAHTARLLAIYGTTQDTAPPLLSYWTDADLDTVCIELITKTLTDADGNTFDVEVIRMTAQVGYEDLGLLTLTGLDGLELSAAHEEIRIGS